MSTAAIEAVGQALQDRIDERAQAERQKARLYGEMVRDIASDVAITASSAAALALQVGKSVDDLTRDVQLHKRRRDWAARAGKLDTAKADLDQAVLAATTARRVRDEEYARLNSEINASLNRMDMARGAVTEATTAAYDLCRSFPEYLALESAITKISRGEDGSTHYADHGPQSTTSFAMRTSPAITKLAELNVQRDALKAEILGQVY